MEWTPPPNGIAMCQGSGVNNHLKEGASTPSLTAENAPAIPVQTPRTHDVREKSEVEKGDEWWRRRESNPRPQAIRPMLYMLIPPLFLL